MASMRYNFLGRTGVRVSAVALGTNAFGFRADPKTSTDVIHRALDAGVTLLDTANVYGKGGASETIIGQALRTRRHEVLISTKAGADKASEPFWWTEQDRQRLFQEYPKESWVSTPAGWTIPWKGINDGGVSRLHLMQELEGSLQRLQTDYIDVYQVHEFDPWTALEDTLRTLDDMVRSGKVRYVGVAQPSYSAWHLCKSLWASDRRGFVRFESVQIGYSLADRAVEQEMIPLCQDQGIALTAFFPLAAGVLTGKYRRGTPPPKGSRASIQPSFTASEGPFGRLWSEEVLTLAEQVAKVAEEVGCTPAQLALAWLIRRPGVTSAVVGATSAAQLDENLGCLSVDLSDDVQSRLDKLSRSFV